MAIIGQMKDTISIEAQSPVDDQQGGATPAWSFIASEWAKATQLSYSRALLDAGVNFTVAYQFDIRRRGDTYILAGTHRILFNTVYYTIHSVVEVAEDWLRIIAYK